VNPSRGDKAGVRPDSGLPDREFLGSDFAATHLDTENAFVLRTGLCCRRRSNTQDACGEKDVAPMYLHDSSRLVMDRC
jgi:hypothetical protein